VSEERRTADGGLEVRVGDVLIWEGSKPGPQWTPIEDHPGFYWWVSTESYVEYHPKMGLVPAGTSGEEVMVPGLPGPIPEKRNPSMPAREMRVLATLHRIRGEQRQTDLEHQVDIEVHRRALELRAAVIIVGFGILLAIALLIWGRG
jgi:hypothetical protein